MADSEGEFGKTESTGEKCRACDSKDVTVREWESSCGGWTDYRYTCGACGHRWWIEGIDS